MIEITFTKEELDRLMSKVRSSNAVLSASGDWPESKVDKAIMQKLLDADFKARRKNRSW